MGSEQPCQTIRRGTGGRKRDNFRTSATTADPGVRRTLARYVIKCKEGDYQRSLNNPDTIKSLKKDPNLTIKDRLKRYLCI